MNDNVEKLIGELKETFPGISIDTEVTLGGIWFVDTTFNKKWTCIEWSPYRGFCTYADDAVMFEGPEKINLSIEEMMTYYKSQYGIYLVQS